MGGGGDDVIFVNCTLNYQCLFYKLNMKRKKMQTIWNQNHQQIIDIVPRQELIWQKKKKKKNAPTGGSRGGQSVTPDSKKLPKIGKNIRKNREEKANIGKILSLCPS